MKKFKKKCLVVLFSLFVAVAAVFLAITSYNIGSQEDMFNIANEGNNSEVFEIKNETDFKDFCERVKTNPSLNAKLFCSIDLSDDFGTIENYNGNFNGGEDSGWVITFPDCDKFLFDTVGENATVENLTLTYDLKKERQGGGICYENKGIVTNFYYGEDFIESLDKKIFEDVVRGFCRINNGKIRNCSSGDVIVDDNIDSDDPEAQKNHALKDAPTGGTTEERSSSFSESSTSEGNNSSVSLVPTTSSTFEVTQLSSKTSDVVNPYILFSGLMVLSLVGFCFLRKKKVK